MYELGYNDAKSGKMLVARFPLNEEYMKGWNDYMAEYLKKVLEK